MIKRAFAYLVSPAANPNEGLTPSAASFELCKGFEGLWLTARRCPEGVPTAGWGHTGPDVELGKRYTQAQCDQWLREDAAEHVAAVLSAVKVPLTRNQLGALWVWSFNVGKGWVTGKGHQQATLIKLLNAGNYDAVPAQLLRFARGANTGEFYRGLYRRRAAEGALWQTPDTANDSEPESETPVPQSVAPSQGSLKPRSRTLYGVAVAAFGWMLDAVANLAELLPAIRDQADAIAGPLGSIVRTASLQLPHLGLIAVAIGLIIVLEARIRAANEQKEG
jgi:lysozyme